MDLTEKRKISSELPYTNPFQTIDWKEFACGWGAAVANISITYPINKVIFRQMLHGVKAHKAILDLHREGIYFLYRGILPPLYQKTISMSIMFGVYDASYNYMNVSTKMNMYLAKTVSGIIAGTLEAVLMPFERIQTLLQHSQFHQEFKNMNHAFRGLRYYGIKEYYRGLVPILLRNGPSNACFFIIRDEVQCRLPKYESAIETSLTNFLSGAIIGVTISAIFYPLNVIKVSMQKQLGGEYQNVVTVFIQIYRERGCKLRNIYHGLGTNSTRAFFSWGVICAAYENLKNILY